MSPSEDVELKYVRVVKRLESLSTAQEIKGRTWSIFKYALDATSAYGVSIPNLRKIAREIGKDHEFAQRLWTANIRETRILATLVDEPDKVTNEQMEKWASDFYYWEICDQCCMNLFAKTRFAYDKSFEWTARKEEYVKRAGFVLIARFAIGRNKANDKQLEAFIHVIKREAADRRDFVKRAISSAIRKIGKRSYNLNRKAIAAAEEMINMDSRSARWIGEKVIKELTSDAVQKRLVI